MCLEGLSDPTEKTLSHGGGGAEHSSIKQNLQQYH